MIRDYVDKCLKNQALNVNSFWRRIVRDFLSMEKRLIVSQLKDRKKKFIFLSQEHFPKNINILKQNIYFVIQSLIKQAEEILKSN